MHHGARPTPRPVSARTSPQVSARVPFSRRRQPWGAAGIAFAGCALALILSSCAYYSADIETIDADGQTVSMEVTVVQGPWAMLKRGDLSTLAKVDSEGAWETRAGGSQEGVDNATGINEALETVKDAAVALAPFIAQYLAAQQAMDLAADGLAARAVRSKSGDAATSSTLTPIAIEGLDLAPGMHEPIGEATP